MVWEWLQKRNELSRSNKVTLFWVPEHMGIEGNKNVDDLVKKRDQSYL